LRVSRVRRGSGRAGIDPEIVDDVIWVRVGQTVALRRRMSPPHRTLRRGSVSREVQVCGSQILMNVTRVLAPGVGMQPRCTLLHQIASQGDSFDGGQSAQMANRCESFTSADRHKDAVAFNGAQMRLDGLSERPGQLGFLHASLHGH
jgi:hypothetical protein